MTGLILVWFSVFIILMVLLKWILPGFEKQKRMSDFALEMSKNSNEKFNHSQLTKIMLSQFRKKNIAVRLFGSKSYQMYLALGYTDNYEIYILKSIAKGFFMASVPYLAYLLYPEQRVLLIGIPVLFVIFATASVGKIKKEYGKRQNLLIRDLPNLISKMLIALSSNSPLQNIFIEVSQDKDTSPLLRQMLLRLLANTEKMTIQNAVNLFAIEVDLPIIYDFASIVNIVIEKGFQEAESQLNEIKDGLRELSELSLAEQTSGQHHKITPVLVGGVLIVMVWGGNTFFNIFTLFNSL